MRTINLLFHGIGTPGRTLEPGEAPYWITRRFFLEVLDEVHENDGVRITFDDGNTSDVSLALPELRERGLHATFFLLAGRLGASGSLGTQDVQELLAAGMSIGTHGMNHLPWRGMGARERHEELVRARSMLETVVGQPITEAALPLGQYDRDVLRSLRDLGYTRVHTSDRRMAVASDWLQPRFSVRAGDDLRFLREEVLSAPSGSRRLRDSMVGLVKRLR